MLRSPPVNKENKDAKDFPAKSLVIGFWLDKDVFS